MKRYLTRHLSMTAIAAISVALFSCKDDEDPVVPVVSFQQAARTVGEDAGTIDLILQLDVDAPREIKVRYTLSGTASEGTTTSSDYQVLGTYGEITIPEGASSGTLQLQIRQDLAVEADETVIVTINDIVNSTATIGATPATTVTIQSDDAGAKVSFATATRTVNEDIGLIDIELTLDKAAGQDLTVDYAFNYDFDVATAIDTVAAFENEIPARYYDFLVEGGNYGKATVPAGATTAKITLRIYSDFLLENDEMIEMNLTGVSTGGQLGTSTKHTIMVEQQDGRALGLTWDNDAYTDVDMDLFLWIGEDEASLAPFVVSAEPSTTVKEETIFMPKILAEEIGDATFGLSFVYYSGTASPMTFTVHHVDFVAGAFEPGAGWDSYTATYTSANLNAWDVTGGLDPQVEQTFKLTAGAYTDISSPIIVPASSSRRASPELPAGIRKSTYKPKFAPRRLN